MLCFEPTRRPSAQELSIDGVTLVCLELNGDAVEQGHWKQYKHMAGAVFMVDCSDNDALERSRALLLDISTHMPHWPVLILGNKSDLCTYSYSSSTKASTACPAGLATKNNSSTPLPLSDVRSIAVRLGLEDAAYCADHGMLWQCAYNAPWKIYSCSVVKREGYHSGLRWLIREATLTHPWSFTSACMQRSKQLVSAISYLVRHVWRRYIVTCIGQCGIVIPAQQEQDLHTL